MSNTVLVLVEIDVPENEDQNESIFNLGQVVETLKNQLAGSHNVQHVRLVIGETAETIREICAPDPEEETPDTSTTRTEQFLNPGL